MTGFLPGHSRLFLLTNHLGMSAFNEQFVNPPFTFFTLTDVILPGPVPHGITYKSEPCTAIYKGLPSSASYEEIEWYRQTISPDIDRDDKEHNVKVFIHTLHIFDPSHYVFKWVLELTEILKCCVLKHTVYVNIGSNGYSSIRDDVNGGHYSYLGTISAIIRHTIDLMYTHNIPTTFIITAKSNYHCSNSYRSCNHNGYPSGPDKCFWCYLRENDIPYGIYLFDKQVAKTWSDWGTTFAYYFIECVIYDINSEVIDWIIKLERFYQLQNIHFTKLSDYCYDNNSNNRNITQLHYPLLNKYAYLTPERLSLLIKLMKEDSHLLDRIYGTSSCELVSETIIDVPPRDKSSIETQTEPPKGLISRIFGL